MPPVCTVCTHEARDAIERELVMGRSCRSIALKHPPLSEWAVNRHKLAHLSAALVATARGKEARRARSLLSRVEGIVTEAEGILTGAKESGKVSAALAAIRELRGLYELLGRLTGELKPDSAVTVVNVQQDPEWIAIRSRLLAALAPFPAAREAVILALSSPADIRPTEPLLVGSSHGSAAPSPDRDGRP
jgi:hypothetical protein